MLLLIGHENPRKTTRHQGRAKTQSLKGYFRTVTNVDAVCKNNLHTGLASHFSPEEHQHDCNRCVIGQWPRTTLARQSRPSARVIDGGLEQPSYTLVVIGCISAASLGSHFPLGVQSEAAAKSRTALDLGLVLHGIVREIQWRSKFLEGRMYALVSRKRQQLSFRPRMHRGALVVIERSHR